MLTWKANLVLHDELSDQSTRLEISFGLIAVPIGPMGLVFFLVYAYMETIKIDQMWAYMYYTWILWLYHIPEHPFVATKNHHLFMLLPARHFPRYCTQVVHETFEVARC